MLIEYKEIFDELNSKEVFHFGSYISGSQYLKAYELVKAYTKIHSNVLDWGSGSGHFSYFLLKQEYNVSAFTIEQKINLGDFLQVSFPDKYKALVNQDPLAPLPFDIETFDTVVSIGVLEHMRDTGNNEINSLNEIRRILKPNGVFVCYHFPNRFSWIETITKHLDSKYNHSFKYNLKDIKSLTTKCNLKLLEYGRYGILPRNTFRRWQNNILLTKLFNLIDSSLSFLLNPICQNFYFVAKKNE